MLILLYKPHLLFIREIRKQMGFSPDTFGHSLTSADSQVWQASGLLHSDVMSTASSVVVLCWSVMWRI
jgi:hypothetical protein